ncbi:helix-turn-helix domain-containing protein [uncultured Leifsonia sp.]|uniref:helix-turn-helix domain-containing protein n=1 Tax=uncultured Leifsonia sp. TaxID=340359 RepID=UPI002600459D|nr:helix-turn-helix domain-containing protein [uncultured Leifsonia sp.]
MRLRLPVFPVTSGLDALFNGRKETLTVPEVAEMLGLTKPGVYKWLKDGVIPGYKLGSTWFILRDELKEALEQGANSRRTQPSARGEEHEEG